MPRCKNCGAPIVFARTQSGALMPLNPHPDSIQGKTACRPHGAQLVGARTVTETRPLAPGERLYLAHWATCTNRPQSKPKTTNPRPEPSDPALF